MEPNMKPMLRPAQFVEHQLVTAILRGDYTPGTALPNERTLAQKLGVTRPTLRETLQRLAGEGWVAIRHGKPTVVNDYWKTGGLRLLGTMANYAEFLPKGFIVHLLEIRISFIPEVARLAAKREPGILQTFLEKEPLLGCEAEAFATFDWDLQVLMTRHSGNPIYPLMLNDFAQVFGIMAVPYFSLPEARDASRRYYRELLEEIESSGEGVEQLVRSAMEESIVIWNRIDTDGQAV